VSIIVPESPANALSELLLDDEWAALGSAHAIVLDCDTGSADADNLDGIERAERRIRRVHAVLASHGVLDALWLRHWRGAHVAGVGAGGVALLGAAPPGALGPAEAQPRALLPIMLRAGGGRCGWSAMRAALACAGPLSCKDGGACCAGVLLGSAVSVEPAIWWQVRACALRTKSAAVHAGARQRRPSGSIIDEDVAWLTGLFCAAGGYCGAAGGTAA